jgi:hypothetical protein
MVIFETPFANILHLNNTNTLVTKWLEKPDNAAFVETYGALLQYVTENHLVRLYCTDLTSIGSLTREQEAWLSLEFYQKAYNIIKAVCYVAVVFSEGHFRAIVSNYQLPAALPPPNYVQLNYFTDQEEALHWLESIKEGQDATLLQPFPDLLKSSNRYIL